MPVDSAFREPCFGRNIVERSAGVALAREDLKSRKENPRPCVSSLDAWGVRLCWRQDLSPFIFEKLRQSFRTANMPTNSRPAYTGRPGKLRNANLFHRLLSCNLSRCGDDPVSNSSHSIRKITYLQVCDLIPFSIERKWNPVATLQRVEGKPKWVASNVTLKETLLWQTLPLGAPGRSRGRRSKGRA